MESDMIERVACAMFMRGRSGVDAESWGEEREEMRSWWRARAKDAIEEMREPTEAMIGAGFRPAYVRSVEAPPVVYRAMIDAALAPSPTPQG